MADTQRILAGWLIDGTGGPIQKRVMLTVRDGIIDTITPFSKERVPDGDVCDFSYATLLPPLVDCHVHLAMSGSVDPKIREQQLHAGCRQLYPVIAAHLAHQFAHGVLTIRDGGDKNGCVLRFMESDDSALSPVVVIQTGRAWHQKGRYGGLIGRCPEDGESLAESYRRCGDTIHQVKLVNSGLNSLKSFGKVTAKQFGHKEIRELVELAERQGRKVMVHANGVDPVREALEGGCHSIEHGFFMGEDNLKRMAQSGTVWVPTAFTMKAYAQMMDDRGEKESAAVARKNVRHQLEQIAKARELGVVVALGTDAGSSGVLHGESMVEEMKLFRQAGYSLQEIIQCATGNGARLLGLAQPGTVVEGGPADFLAARGTPAQLPRKLGYLENIFTGGRPHPLYRKNPFKHTAA